MANFRTKNGDTHLIDNAGNHFVNGKCVNPKEDVVHNYATAPIGSTYPPLKGRSFLPDVTGSAPFRLDNEGRFIRL
jgi:hypothetical protein